MEHWKPKGILAILKESKETFLKRDNDVLYKLSSNALKQIRLGGVDNRLKERIKTEIQTLISKYKDNRQPKGCAWSDLDELLKTNGFSSLIKGLDEKAGFYIMPYLLHWQQPRFCDRSQGFQSKYSREFKRFFREYIDKLTEIYNKIDKEISFFELTYYKYIEIFKKAAEYLENEPVSVAKVLHIINPKAFIPWDSQIAEVFGVEKNAHGYACFSCHIKNWILNNIYVMKLESEDYSVLRILDMAFYLYANGKIDRNSPLGEGIFSIIREIRLV